jgi:predicted AlkP superfamily pyrophosphatase or phosphodiesterase
MTSRSIRSHALAGALVTALVCGACTSAAPRTSSQPESAARLPPQLRSLFPTPSDDRIEPADGWLEAACGLPHEYLTRISRGHHPGRSYDIYFVPRAPNFIGRFDYTTHGGPWDYLQQVPLVFYGPGFIRKQGSISLGREVTLADVAPTMARLLNVPWDPGRNGRPINEVLVPPSERSGNPKLILTVVWDGGGSDVLATWPDSWPNLARLMREGTSIEGAIVGSAPSVTPPVHTTLGTGAFPNQHGITDLTMQNGERVIDSFSSATDTLTPENMKLETLADVYDRSVGNRATVGLLGFRGWHLGMMGRGAYSPGGDKDIAVIAERGEERFVTNTDYYSLPPYVHHIGGIEAHARTADLTDGKADGQWLGRVSLEDPITIEYTPAWTLFQTRVATQLLSKEGFGRDKTTDMFFINYKQIDDVGHFYDMLGREMSEIVRFTDDALGDLSRLLDERVGHGEWILVMTADHGETPFASATGGWPIDSAIVADAVAQHFGTSTSDLIVKRRTMGFWLDEQTMEQNDFGAEEVSDYLTRLTLEDTLAPGQEIPDEYRARAEEPVFEAAFPGDAIDEIRRCARRTSAN